MSIPAEVKREAIQQQADAAPKVDIPLISAHLPIELEIRGRKESHTKYIKEVIASRELIVDLIISLLQSPDFESSTWETLSATAMEWCVIEQHFLAQIAALDKVNQELRTKSENELAVIDIETILARCVDQEKDQGPYQKNAEQNHRQLCQRIIEGTPDGERFADMIMPSRANAKRADAETDQQQAAVAEEEEEEEEEDIRAFSKLKVMVCPVTQKEIDVPIRAPCGHVFEKAGIESHIDRFGKAARGSSKAVECPVQACHRHFSKAELKESVADLKQQQRARKLQRMKEAEETEDVMDFTQADV